MNPSNNYSSDSGQKLPKAVDLKMSVASDGLSQRANCAGSPKRKLFEEVSVLNGPMDFANNTDQKVAWRN
jgi:hypothetical protein